MTTASHFTHVPVIDVSPLLTGSASQQAEVAQQLGVAARDVGFFYVTGGGVADELFERLLASTRQFFALPLDDKMRVFIGNSTNHRGYVPIGEEVFAGGTTDLKEAYDLALDLPACDPAAPMLGPNQWPELAGFRESTTAYYDAVMSLGRALLRGFALALGEQSDFFDNWLTKPPSQLRLLHYPCNDEATDSVGIGAHTDYECFTLLKPTAPGLEVLNGAGDWIDVPPMPGAFVVNIGDMLETWTNGQFVATTHRVRKVKEERFSFPLFFSVDYDTHIEPLATFVTPGTPARQGMVAGDHLWAQTMQSFTYLQRKLAAGDVRLPEGALALSSFGAAPATPTRNQASTP